MIGLGSLSSSWYAVNGVRLHVVEAGPPDGPALLLLHGFPEFWYGWRKQIAFFAGQGYRVVVPDQRGYNRSSKPRGIEAYRLQELTQDLVELIAALGGQKVLLAGHDWGALVVWSLLIRHPELVQRAVILNVPHPAVLRPTLRHRPDQLLRSWYILFLQIPWLPEKLIGQNRFWFLKNALRRTSLPGTFSTEDLEQYEQAWAQPGSLMAMFNWYRALRYRRNSETASPPPLHYISPPVLILWGKKDAFLVPELAEASLRRCVRGRLLFFDDATHWVHLEKSEEVNQVMADFFREADP